MRWALVALVVAVGLAAAVAVHERESTHHAAFNPWLSPARSGSPTPAEIAGVGSKPAYTEIVWNWQDPAGILIVGLTAALGAAILSARRPIRE